MPEKFSDPPPEAEAQGQRVAASWHLVDTATCHPWRMRKTEGKLGRTGTKVVGLAIVVTLPAPGWHRFSDTPWSRSTFFSSSCENLDVEWDSICGISDICINIILGSEFLLYEQRNKSEETTEVKSLKDFISIWYFPVQSFEWCLYGCAHRLGISLSFPSSTHTHTHTHTHTQNTFKKKIGATYIHGKVEANFLASCVI